MCRFDDWLTDDVEQNRKIIKTNDTQTARRNYLRSLSANYEFTLSLLCERTAQLLVENYELNGYLNFHEIYPLMIDSVRLTDNGKLKLDKNRLPFLPLVAYTLKTYAKLIDSNTDILADHRWESFSMSIRIRNRITHPKLDSDIEINDDELKIIDDGWIWWVDLVAQLRKADLQKFINS